MKICLKCNRGLFDNDIKCDKCGCSDIMDKKTYQNLYNKFKNSSQKERIKLRQTSEYQIICKYKFIIDNKNTPEMRKQQSLRDKQKNQNNINKSNLIKPKQSFSTATSPQYIPKCPTCQSTNIIKISATKKALGFVTVGFFSSNFGKTMECKNCGYKW